MDEDHPFQPGARVAIQQDYGWRSVTYREAFVDKLYKTGRFTMKGDAERKQWTPSKSTWTGETFWEASFSGYRGRLLIWDASTNAKIAGAIADAAHDRKVSDVTSKVGRMNRSRVTPEVLTHLEAAISAYGPDPT